MLKYALPKNNQIFSYSLNSQNILLKGTLIKDCESVNNKETIKALVINTSYGTYKGNMIQNFLFDNKTNFNFFKELFLVFVIFFVLFISFGMYIIFNSLPSKEEYEKYEDMQNVNEYYKTGKIYKIMDLITIILPPVLPIASTFSFLIFHYVLNKNSISCFSKYRLHAASLCNKIIYDKTGTLTDDEIQLSGFKPTKIDLSYINDENSHKIVFNEQMEIEELNSLHKHFWKNFCKNESKNYSSTSDKAYVNDVLEDPAKNVIYFIECLASCHSIDKIKNIYHGNSLDKKIFDMMKWILIPKKKVGNLIRKSGIYQINRPDPDSETKQKIDNRERNISKK